MYSKGNKLTGASRKTNTDDLVSELGAFASGGSAAEVKSKLFECMKGRGHPDESVENRWNLTRAAHADTPAPLDSRQACSRWSSGLPMS